MGSTKAGRPGSLDSRVNRAVAMLARDRAGLGSRAGSFARPGFGNIRREELSGFGRSTLGALVPSSVKPVPVVLGTVLGVAGNSAIGRLLESPSVGINLNPLLSRVLLLGAGILGHVAAKADFTLGLLVGQLPGLIDAGMSSLMDMVLGETSLAGTAGMGASSQEALAELRALRRQLEGAPSASSVPMGLRARAAA